MPCFVAPVWNSTDNHYVLDITAEYKNDTTVEIQLSNSRSTIFSNTDDVTEKTNRVIGHLIKEGEENKWFSKLPTHANLMKRVSNTFNNLANTEQQHAFLLKVLMSPKTLVFIWEPFTKKKDSNTGFTFESDSEMESEPEITQSNLPPVPITTTNRQTKEEYLLARLRAAKARVETEEIRMEYFETTGYMPPDSEIESEEE
jgi:hypothetical protein